MRVGSSLDRLGRKIYIKARSDRPPTPQDTRAPPKLSQTPARKDIYIYQRRWNSTHEGREHTHHEGEHPSFEIRRRPRRPPSVAVGVLLLRLLGAPHLVLLVEKVQRLWDVAPGGHALAAHHPRIQRFLQTQVAIRNLATVLRALAGRAVRHAVRHSRRPQKSATRSGIRLCLPGVSIELNQGEGLEKNRSAKKLAKYDGTLFNEHF